MSQCYIAFTITSCHALPPLTHKHHEPVAKHKRQHSLTKTKGDVVLLPGRQRAGILCAPNQDQEEPLKMGHRDVSQRQIPEQP